MKDFLPVIRRFFAFILRVILAILIIIGIFGSYHIVTNLMLDNTREKANGIIKNIELYEQDNGFYPKELDELIPKYYSTIPVNFASIFYKFEYFLYEGGNKYWLEYTYLAPFGRYVYSYDRKEWWIMD